MPSRPIIGIPAQTQGAMGTWQPIWNLNQAYVFGVTQAGGVPWIIPLLSDDPIILRAIYDKIDGLLLTGGVDVDPAHYGEEPLPICDKPDRPRDVVEMTLTRWALADRKPILAVCRGIQLLNVACGGALYQDVATQHPTAIKHDYFPAVVKLPRDHLAHEVRVQPGSRLADALGTEGCQVNSMHHQGIKRLAPTLSAAAHAPDGLVEGVEMPAEPFVVGVQWHPEELTATHEPSRRLFAAFVAAA